MNASQKNKAVFLLISIFTLLEYGCNSVSHRIGIAEEFLKSQIDSVSNHLLEFTDFRKIDGVEKQSDGTYYILSYKGRVDAKKDCYWNGVIINHNLINNGILGLSSMRISESPDGLEMGERYGEYSLYKTGYGHHVKGQIVFEKHDSGWVIVDMSIEIYQEPEVKAEAQNTISHESNDAKLVSIKKQVEAVDKKSKYREVYVKFHSQDKLAKINNLRWPENTDDITIIYNLFYSPKKKLIAFSSSAFDPSGDSDQALTHYFDENGKTIGVDNTLSIIYSDSDGSQYEPGKLYHFKSERTYDKDFKIITENNTIKDEKSVQDKKFDFEKFNHPHVIYPNVTAILKDSKISTY